MADVSLDVWDIFSGSPNTEIYADKKSLSVTFSGRPVAELVYAHRWAFFALGFDMSSWHGPKVRRLANYLKAQGYNTNLI